MQRNARSLPELRRGGASGAAPIATSTVAEPVKRDASTTGAAAGASETQLARRGAAPGAGSIGRPVGQGGARHIPTSPLANAGSSLLGSRMHWLAPPALPPPPAPVAERQRDRSAPLPSLSKRLDKSADVFRRFGWADCKGPAVDAALRNMHRPTEQQAELQARPWLASVARVRGAGVRRQPGVRDPRPVPSWNFRYGKQGSGGFGCPPPLPPVPPQQGVIGGTEEPSASAGGSDIASPEGSGGPLPVPSKARGASRPRPGRRRSDERRDSRKPSPVANSATQASVPLLRSAPALPWGGTSAPGDAASLDDESTATMEAVDSSDAVRQEVADTVGQVVADAVASL